MSALTDEQHEDIKREVRKAKQIVEKCQRSFAAPAGSAALVREQDAANELYQAACTLMRYKEAQQWHNLENAAHRFNAARQARILEVQMRQNEGAKPQPR